VKKNKKLNILISAGPTQEPLDPVRFISNYSTGFLGYAIAKEAKGRGHRVVLVSGPTSLAKPKGTRIVNVQTAQQMQRALNQKFSWCDSLIMTAAICDFRCAKKPKNKIKRGMKTTLTLKFKTNPDILKGLGRKKGHKLLVGTALETKAPKRDAQRKLREKNLDIIVATSVTAKSYPFGNARMDAIIIDKHGKTRRLKAAKKPYLARILLDSLEGLMLS